MRGLCKLSWVAYGAFPTGESKKVISMDRFAKGPSTSNTTNGASSNEIEMIEVITHSGEESSGGDGIQNRTASGEESSGGDGIQNRTDSGEESSGSDGILERHIDKVHPILRSDKRSEGCYDPKVVSVGPYHHGNEKLQNAEELKPWVAEMLVSRSDHNMDDFREKVLEKVPAARRCYVNGSTENYSDGDFAEMMLLDACLVLAFIEAPVYKDRSILNKLVTCLGMQALHVSGTDIFNLLENQIPFLVLETVMSLKYQGDLWMETLDIFCDGLMSFGVEDYTENAKAREICKKKPLHLLEYFWLRERAFDQPNNSLTSRGTAGTSAEQTSINKSINSFRSVSELKSKGIHVRPSGVHSTKAVEFTSFFFFGLLKLPLLVFTPEWIIKCSNFVAYELNLNDPNNLPTMAYVNFMKSLINCPDDVKELRSKSILFTTFSNDKQVVEHFNGIMITSVAEDFKLYGEVEMQIQKHYLSKLKSSIAELRHNYFSSPWTFLAFLAATLLLIFTFLQFYYTMYPRRDRF